MTTANHYFTKHSLSFLKQLSNNNNRDWFDQNKNDYEVMVRTPALKFIEDMAGQLAVQSPHFLAIPRKVGGSLMRVHRDVRFSKDKRPYKTNIGIQFRHERGKDVHAPGFYLHIEPDECFIGVGIWRPDSSSLAKIRQAISEKPEKWTQACNAKAFKKHFELRGDSLIRPPRGFDADHPLITDLKRKDFIAVSPFKETQLFKPDFKKRVAEHFQMADDYMRFLCKALELNY